jgi:hypothetical protein
VPFVSVADTGRSVAEGEDKRRSTVLAKYYDYSTAPEVFTSSCSLQGAHEDGAKILVEPVTPSPKDCSCGVQLRRNSGETVTSRWGSIDVSKITLTANSMSSSKIVFNGNLKSLDILRTEKCS